MGEKATGDRPEPELALLGLQTLYRRLSFPARFPEQVTREAIPQLVKGLSTDQQTAANARRAIENDLVAIYEAAFAGRA